MTDENDPIIQVLHQIAERLAALTAEMKTKNDIEAKRLEFNEQKEQAYAIVRERMKTGKKFEVEGKKIVTLLEGLVSKVTALEQQMETTHGGEKGASDNSE